MNEVDRADGAIEAVVIGASAGGVEALSAVLPARPSLVADIFSARCAAPVREAEDKEPVVQGTIYFAPPDYHLLLDRGSRGVQLALSTDAPVHFSRPSVDVLFESAADAYGSRLLGVILTGASRDGADGLAAIGRAGGRMLVQEPATAQVALMTEAAIRSCPAAEVRTLAGIAALFAGLGRGSRR